MRALIIAEEEKLAVEIGQVLRDRALGYAEIEVATPAAAIAHARRFDPNLIVVALSPAAAAVLDLLQETRDAVQSALVVVGPTDDAKLVLRVLRQGADEYVDRAELKVELPDSLRKVSARRPVKVESGRVIGVLGASGGVGSSTVAANLAVLLATWHKQASLIDMQMRSSDQEVLLDVKPVHHLAELCRKAFRLDPIMFQQSLVCHSSGVHLLAAPGTWEEVQDVTPPAIRKVVSLARTTFPYVVLDLDRSLQAEQLAALAQVDVLLLVLRLDIASLRNARRLLEGLRRLGLADDRVWVTVNRYGQAKELPVRKFEQALGIPIPYQIPDDPAAMNQAGNSGTPVVLGCPNAKVSQRFVRMATDVKNFQPPHRRNGHGSPPFSQAAASVANEQ